MRQVWLTLSRGGELCPGFGDPAGVGAFLSECDRRSADTLIFGVLPPLFEVFLPNLCPGTAVVIDIPFVPEYELRGPSIRTVDDDAGRRTFAPCKSGFRIVKSALK